MRRRVQKEIVLGAADHLLEIGTGWGSFALHAAGRYGCRVTTTTLSAAQGGSSEEERARMDLIAVTFCRLSSIYLNLERHDLALQTAVDRDTRLASASTLCRWENRADRAAAWRLHEVLVEQFIASYRRAPKRLILDFDATDDAVHGQQVGRFFHGYYDHYCFLPLYVFCGKQLLVSYLRPSKIDGAKHAWAILALLVKRLRRLRSARQRQRTARRLGLEV